MENRIALRQGRVTVRVSKSVSSSRVSESSIVSPDGLLMGRPDEVRVSEGRVTIVEYKSGRYSEDSIVAFEDQVKFYAGLWLEANGVLPDRGRIEFLLDQRNHDFAIDEEHCSEILDEARGLAITLAEEDEPLPATLGPHCVVCDFRPWCSDYWERGADEVRSSGDFEGTLCGFHAADSKAACLLVNDEHIGLMNRRIDPFPTWPTSGRLRVTNTVGEGSSRFVTRWSEIHLVESQPG